VAHIVCVLESHGNIAAVVNLDMLHKLNEYFPRKRVYVLMLAESR